MTQTQFRTLPCKLKRAKGSDFIAVERRTHESFFLAERDYLKKGLLGANTIDVFTPFIIEPHATVPGRYQLTAFLLAPPSFPTDYTVSQPNPKLVIGPVLPNEGSAVPNASPPSGIAGLVKEGTPGTDFEILRGQCETDAYTAVAFSFAGNKFLHWNTSDEYYYISTVEGAAMFPTTACFNCFEMLSAATQINHVQLLTFVSTTGCSGGALMRLPVSEDPAQYEENMRKTMNPGGVCGGPVAEEETPAVTTTATAKTCDTVCASGETCTDGECKKKEESSAISPWWLLLALIPVIGFLVLGVSVYKERKIQAVGGTANTNDKSDFNSLIPGFSINK